MGGRDIVDALTSFYRMYAYQYKKQIGILLAGAILSGAIEIMGLLLLYILLRFLININSFDDSHIVIRTLNSFGIANRNHMAAIIGMAITVTFVAKNIYIIFYYHTQHLTLRRWKIDLGKRLMEGYMAAPYQIMLGYNSSTIIRNVNNIVAQALNGFVLSGFNFFSNMIVGLILLSILYVKYFTITLITASTLVVSTILQNKFIKKKTADLGRERDKLMVEQNKSVYQGLHSLKETKVLLRENFFLKNFETINNLTVDNDTTAMLYARLPSHITEVVIIISIVMISVVVLFENSHDSSLSVASLGILAAVAFRIAPIMNRTTAALQGLSNNLNSMKTLFAEFQKLKDYKLLNLDRKNINALPFNSTIKLQKVNYRYPKARSRALADINLAINRGEVMGVVGESGAGKTTLIDLILGLIAPTEGNLSIDNVLITESNTKNWQKNVCYVPQAVYLSDASIRSNIAFGVPDNEIDDGRIVEVLKDVDLYDHVMALDGGIAFAVGENGKNLSGGQKQRVGIARALYLDADVIVLDEATAALDVGTEYKITETIKKIKNKKTIIVIAHRLSTIYEADRVVFMKDAKVVDVGTFSELVGRNPAFEDMAIKSRLVTNDVASQAEIV